MPAPLVIDIKEIAYLLLDPLTGVSSSIFHPRTMQWQEHFTWREEYSVIDGFTSIGRATVALLKMNLPSTCRFRQALTQLGVHPTINTD